MTELNFSPRFLDFLQDYANSVGKDPVRIVEEAVGQAILRHRSPADPSPHDQRILMGPASRKQLLSLLPEFHPRTETDSPFGVLLERLPDQNWTYQLARLGECWLIVVSKTPQRLPPPIEVKSIETNQAYCWLFGYTKAVKLWSGPERFLIVF